jgi:hypothetical protein
MLEAVSASDWQPPIRACTRPRALVRGRARLDPTFEPGGLRILGVMIAGGAGRAYRQCIEIGLSDPPANFLPLVSAV